MYKRLAWILLVVSFWAPWVAGWVPLDIGVMEGPISSIELFWLGWASLHGLGFFALASRGGEEAGALPLPGVPWIAAGTAAVALGIGLFGTRGAPLTGDEWVYLWQAQALWAGNPVQPAFPVPEAIHHSFLVQQPGPDGSWWAAGIYPLAAPLLTLPGWLVGWPGLLWAALGGLIVWATAGLARDLRPDLDPRVPALFAAASPSLLLVSAHMHTSLLTTLLHVLLARLLVRGPSAGWWWAAALGVVLGLEVHARPVDGALAVAVAATWLGVRAVRRREVGQVMRWAPWTLLAAAPFAAAFLAYNGWVTGHPLRTPYSLLPGGPVYGLGTSMFGAHDLRRAVDITALGAARLSIWLLGFPVWAWVFRAIGDRWLVWGTLGLAAAQLGLYAPAPFIPVYTAGTTYHLVLVPLFAIAVARSFPDLRRAMPLVLGVASTFLASQVIRVSWIGDTTMAPYRAAAELAETYGPLVIVRPDEEANQAPAMVYLFPVPSPRPQEDPVLWVAPGPAEDRVFATFPERAVFRAVPVSRAEGYRFVLVREPR